MEKKTIEPQLFPLGAVVMTANFSSRLGDLGEDVGTLAGVALRKHQSGDWGELAPSDARQNDEAVKSGERIHSVYRTRSGEKYWVITEWDRSVTTLLLPSDY